MFEFCHPALFQAHASSAAALLGCPPLLDALLRGGLIGILGLAGLFNLILLFANPRNISHLIFSAISLLATAAALLPYLVAEAPGDAFRDRIEFHIYQVWLPLCLFWFVYVLFPALRRRSILPDISGNPAAPGPPRESALFLRAPGFYRAAVAGGLYAVSPAAAGLVLGLAFAPGGGAAPVPAMIALFAAGYAIFAGICTALILLAAALQRQQGALVASAGFIIFAAGMSLDALATRRTFELFEAAAAFESFASYPAMSRAAASALQPRIFGVLGFVLSMVILMGPNRYEMHRQLRRSRNVLRDANRKLRHLDALKNRYITGSAREMQPPLEGMLEQCMQLVEDPTYRLGRSQLAALSGVMDMARKMIQRNERAAVLFAATEIRAREFDAVRFFEMLLVVLEEQLHPLRFKLSLDASTPTGQVPIFADPTLIETAFVELAENARSHGVAKRIEIRVADDAGRRGRVRLAFLEAPLPRGADELGQLTEEFQRGAGPSVPGIGLGLSLVRRIAENHGSRLEIQRAGESGRGIEFSFCVPRAGPAMRPPEVEWGLKHVRFLLQHDRRGQAADEARLLALRFPETRAELHLLLEDHQDPEGR